MDNIISLPNLGNTCYLNSVLQSLLHLKSFKTFLLNNTNIISKSKLLIYFNNLFFNKEIDIKNTLKQIINITKTYKINGTYPFYNNIEINNQNDAYDILAAFLQIFYEETKKYVNINIINESYINNYNNIQNMTIDTDIRYDNNLSYLWLFKYIKHKQNDNKLITQSNILNNVYNSHLFNMFESVLCDIVVRKNNINSFDTTQFIFTPIIDLNIDKINLNNIVTIEDILNLQTNEINENIKTFSVLWKLTNIVIFRFKCFQITDNQKNKINLNLKITPIICFSNNFSKFSKYNNSKYKLSSIILHHGSSVNNGHYNTLLYNDNFVKCDDSIITECNNIKFVNNPYIMLYELL